MNKPGEDPVSIEQISSVIKAFLKYEGEIQGNDMVHPWAVQQVGNRINNFIDYLQESQP